MKPFSFAGPKTLEEMNQVLAQASSHGDIRPIVGGTDLVDQVKSGRRTPSVIMDIKRIPEMNRIEWVPGEGLHLGAAVNCTDTAAFSPAIDRYMAVKEACELIGSIQIQNRASVVGNIANSAPSADAVPGMLVHEARVVIVGPAGQREVPLDDFFTGPGRNVLAPDEVILETIVPPAEDNSSSHYMRFIPRNEMDIAVAGVASFITLEPGTRNCTKARIALASVAPTPVRATAAEALLENQEITAELVQEAGEKAVEAASPIDDVRGTVEYRKELVRVLTRRTLLMCMESLGQSL